MFFIFRLTTLIRTKLNELNEGNLSSFNVEYKYFEILIVSYRTL